MSHYYSFAEEIEKVDQQLNQVDNPFSCRCGIVWYWQGNGTTGGSSAESHADYLTFMNGVHERLKGYRR